MNKAIKVLKLSVLICLVLSWFCIVFLCFLIKDTDIQALAFVVAFVGFENWLIRFYSEKIKF